MFDITLHYKCAGCDCRWTKRFWCDDANMPERIVIVPEHSSPCCGDGKDDPVTTIEDVRSMPRH